MTSEGDFAGWAIDCPTYQFTDTELRRLMIYRRAISAGFFNDQLSSDQLDSARWPRPMQPLSEPYFTRRGSDFEGGTQIV